MKRKFLFKNGFSLIEMVITIFIIGILSIFSLMYYTGTVEDVKKSKTKVMLEQIKDACKRFYADNGFYPSKVEQLYPKYLNKIPITPWGTKFEINFGEVIEVYSMIPASGGQHKYKVSVLIDTVGFAIDNFTDVTNFNNSAFSFGKINVVPIDKSTQIYNVSFKIQFKSVITPLNLELGSDFRFYVNDAEIESVTSEQSAQIQVTNLGGAEKTGFEYSSKFASDNIIVQIKNCKRTTQFTVQIYRPIGPNIKVFYGQKEILITNETYTPPIVLTRTLGESTKRLK